MSLHQQLSVVQDLNAELKTDSTDPSFIVADVSFYNLDLKGALKAYFR